jgi:hypothetical protein
MPQMDLKQNFRYTDGTLYRAGKNVKVPDGFAEWASGASIVAPAAADSGGSLDGVDFASEAAREAAQQAGLTADAFKGSTASSPNGYTKPDVQALVEKREG